MINDLISIILALCDHSRLHFVWPLWSFCWTVACPLLSPRFIQQHVKLMENEEWCWRFNWLDICRRATLSGPFGSLSVLMMDSCKRCMREKHTHTHTHTHTQWNLPSLCFHLHLFSLVFLHHAVCVRIMGWCTHSSDVCVCCVLGMGGGCFFIGKSNTYEGSSSLLWNIFSPLTTFIYGHQVWGKATKTNKCSDLFLCALVKLFYETFSNMIYVNNMFFANVTQMS